LQVGLSTALIEAAASVLGTILMATDILHPYWGRNCISASHFTQPNSPYYANLLLLLKMIDFPILDPLVVGYDPTNGEEEDFNL
jgi:hypothetical protein